jgi:hypothetical protein
MSSFFFSSENNERLLVKSEVISKNKYNNHVL